MSIIQILVIGLVIIGIIGAGLIIMTLIFLIYGWIESKIIKRRIDDKIKKEVEDGRLKRDRQREEYARGYREPELPTESSKPRNQSISRDDQATRRSNIQIQSTGSTSRSKPDTKIKWAEFD